MAIPRRPGLRLSIRCLDSLQDDYTFPPHRCFSPHRQAFEVRMSAVDDHIALHPRDDRRDKQDGTAIVYMPWAAETTSCLSTWLEPVRQGTQAHRKSRDKKWEKTALFFGFLGLNGGLKLP